MSDINEIERERERPNKKKQQRKKDRKKIYPIVQIYWVSIGLQIHLRKTTTKIRSCYEAFAIDKNWTHYSLVEEMWRLA